MRDAKREKIEALAKEHGVSFEEARVMLRERRWGKAKGILTTALGFIPGVGKSAANAVEAGDKIAKKVKEIRKG